jgi:hypothetical protein
MLAVASPVSAASARASAAKRGAEWIASKQADDGGFFESGQRVDQAAETLAAMVAGGLSGRAVNRAVAYVRKHASSGATRGAYTGRIVAGLIAGGGDPHDASGDDLVAKLHEQYDEGTGAYDTENLFTNLTGANGVVAADGSLPKKAVAYINGHECAGGGFGFENDCSKGPDADTSAWVINVLVAAGHEGDAQVGRAKAYLLSAQQDDGGFGFTKDKTTSADSTGLVLAAIEALGEAATAAPWRQADGDDPVKALLGLQDDSGAFRFVASSRKGNALSTTNAVPGLAKTSYPVPRIETPEASPAATAAPARTTAPTSGAGGGAGPGSVGTSQSPSVVPSASAAATVSPGASPSSAPVSAAQPPPFGATSQETDDEGGLPALVVLGGLALVAAAAGYGVWWSARGRAKP